MPGHRRCDEDRVARVLGRSDLRHAEGHREGRAVSIVQHERHRGGSSPAATSGSTACPTRPWWSISIGATRSAAFWPTASPRGQPNIRSAARFHSVMTPSPVMRMIAWGAAFRTAASRRPTPRTSWAAASCSVMSAAVPIPPVIRPSASRRGTAETEVSTRLPSLRRSRMMPIHRRPSRTTERGTAFAESGSSDTSSWRSRPTASSEVQP